MIYLRRGQDSNLQALAGAAFQERFLTIRSTPPYEAVGTGFEPA